MLKHQLLARLAARRQLRLRQTLPCAAVVAAALLVPASAVADSACWREPLLIGQRAAGLVKAYQLWHRPFAAAGAGADAINLPDDGLPMAQAIPSFDAAGRAGAVLSCGQIKTWVNGRATACTAEADPDDGVLWVAVLEGPARGRVRVALTAGGSVWLRFRPEPLIPEPSRAGRVDTTVAAASLARHGRPGSLRVSTDPWVEPTLRAQPDPLGKRLSWTPRQQALALAFVQQAAPEQPRPGGPWLTSAALGEGGQWQLISQVLQSRRVPQGEWWWLRQWLAPVLAAELDPEPDPEPGGMSRPLRSAVLREGWVQHRDAHGSILAVITDGAACD